MASEMKTSEMKSAASRPAQAQGPTPPAARRWQPGMLLYGAGLVHAGAAVAVLANPSTLAWAAAGVGATHATLAAVGLWPRSTWLGPNVLRLPREAGNCVALTFDDGPHPELTNVGGGGKKTAVQKFLAAGPSSRIAAPQLHIPEERGVRFHTEQRVIGSLATIARIVANLCALLVAKRRDHCAVQIEDETRAMLRQVDEPLQQSIIHTV
jgi:hypothetical protein